MSESTQYKRKEVEVKDSNDAHVLQALATVKMRDECEYGSTTSIASGEAHLAATTATIGSIVDSLSPPSCSQSIHESIMGKGGWLLPIVGRGARGTETGTTGGSCPRTMEQLSAALFIGSCTRVATSTRASRTTRYMQRKLGVLFSGCDACP